MITNTKLGIAIAVGCFLLLVLWLSFWLFIASRNSGRMTLITEVDGHSHAEVSYDSAQRFRPYIPLVVLGVYGALIGAVVSILGRRKSNPQRWFSALVFSPGISALSAVILYGVWAFLTLNTSHPPDLSPANRVLRTLALLLLYSPGVVIFCGLPSVLSAVATACLFSEEHEAIGGSNLSTSTSKSR